jgi:lipid A ethanolaminephosphotransferase
VLVSLFLVVFANGAFFSHVAQTYGLTAGSIAMMASLSVVLLSVTVILLSLFTFRRTTKPFLILILVISSQVAYFMDAYDVVIDSHMIQNLLETNVSESADLLSWKQLGYLVFLGILPSVLIARVRLKPLTLKEAWIDKAKTISIALGVAVVIVIGFSKFYTSFFREHKPLRYYANPAYYLYSAGHYVQQSFAHPYTGLQLYAQDAVALPEEKNRELIIVVVGEAARWDHFSLNGYGRETNPLLKKEDIVNFTQFTSCGTETAVSVPCMFSSFGRENYEKEKAKHTENILDVLKRAGVNVLWRDNNSDSKGVAERVVYEDFKTADKNTICDDGECRDEGMLVGLQEYIDAHPRGDIVIVLHQMGNHGPAYYKRYPKQFEQFTPVCKTNQLEQCTQEEITNAYDNAILYTDYFLTKVVDVLKKNDSSFATAMFYVSDHGESLGENGLYLHGFPYAIAPEAQTHVPAVMWFGKNFAVDKEKLKQNAAKPYSHDFLFHTMLGMSEVKTSVYRPDLDILHGVR